MGHIDSHSDHSLYDVLDGSLGFDNGRPEGSIDFYGFHLIPTGTGTYVVQYDGHVGRVGTIDPDEYDEILELVDDLMEYVFKQHHFNYQDDKEELVEWAGEIMTDDKERAEQEPGLYIHVPKDRPSPADE
jgi:hypothetical protein